MQTQRLTLVLALVVTACAGQTAPEREPLPDAALIIPEPQACGFLVGQGRGVSIDDVIADTAAAGVLQTGDLLVGIDGARVSNADQLRAALGEHAIGDRVSVEVVRDGEEISLEVVLGANPETPDRPMLGVMVVTDFARVVPAELGATELDGRLVRAVGVGNSIYLVDPLEGEWADLELEIPDGFWAVAGSAVLTLEDSTSADAALVDARSGDRLVFDIGNWWGVQILGTLGSDVVVSGARLLPGETDVFELAVLAVDFDSRAAEWIWQVSTGIGVPGVAFPSPDGTRLLLVGQGQEDQVFRHMVMSAEGVPTVPPGELAAAEGAIALGWFDERSFLVRTSEGALLSVDANTGVSSEVTLPAALGTVSRLWPVGDGTHILADTGNSLLRVNLQGATEIRTLADHCQIGLVGSPGWTAAD